MAFRYSITGLMLFTLGIAGGLFAALAVKHVDTQFSGIDMTGLLIVDRISAGLACGLMAWVTVGLACQCFDLRKYLRSDAPQDSQFRASLRFELAWRSLVAMLLPGTYALQALGQRWSAPEDVFTAMGIFLSPSSFNDLRWLLLIVAIGASPGLKRREPGKPPHGILRTALDVAGVVAGMVLAGRILFDAGLVPALVIMALNGVEASHPLSWQRSAIGLNLARVETWFVVIVHLQVLMALAAALFSFAWATSPPKSRLATRALVAAVMLALAAIGAEVALRAAVWPVMSPSFAEAMPLVPVLAVVLILAVAVVYAAARSSYLRERQSPALWRIHPDAYLQERRPVLAVAFLLSLVQIGRGVMEGITYSSFNFMGGGASWIELAFSPLLLPAYYWPLAMVFLSARQWLAASRRDAESFVTTAYSWRRFATGMFVFPLVAISLAFALCNWRIAIWIPMGW
jgi:hypothetical protein